MSVGRKKETHSFTLRVSNSFVNAEDQASRLSSTADRVDLYQTGFPDKRIHVVSYARGSIHVNTKPFAIIGMFHPQFVEDISRIETSVVAYLTGNDLKSLGECSNDKLKFAWNR